MRRRPRRRQALVRAPVPGGLALGAVLGAVLLGCEAELERGAEVSAEDSSVISSSTPPNPSPSVGAMEAPSGGYGFGASVSEAAIAAWNIDVGPDGEGLPEGSGTAVRGVDVYRTQCRACHGEDGSGGPNNVLVSAEPLEAFAFGSDPGMQSTIGNYWPYATTVFDYVRRSMPFDRPGSLEDDDVYAVTAWLLWMNGLIEEDAVMDAQSLPAVRMPAREHFVPSDDVRLTALP